MQQLDCRKVHTHPTFSFGLVWRLACVNYALWHYVFNCLVMFMNDIFHECTMNSLPHPPNECVKLTMRSLLFGWIFFLLSLSLICLLQCIYTMYTVHIGNNIYYILWYEIILWYDISMFIVHMLNYHIMMLNVEQRWLRILLQIVVVLVNCCYCCCCCIYIFA